MPSSRIGWSPTVRKLCGMSAGSATQSPPPAGGRVFLALQPDLGLAFNDEQQLDVGMKMHRRDVARRRGLDAGAHRRVAVGDQRMIEGERSKLDAGRVGELADLRRLKSGHWNSLRCLPGGHDGDTVQDALGPRKPATGRALDAAAPAPKPRGPYKKRAIV